jgi:hypothetical protein
VLAVVDRIARDVVTPGVRASAEMLAAVEEMDGATSGGEMDSGGKTGEATADDDDGVRHAEGNLYL